MPACPPAHRARHYAIQHGGAPVTTTHCARESPRRDNTISKPTHGRSKERNTEREPTVEWTLTARERQNLRQRRKHAQAQPALYEITTNTSGTNNESLVPHQSTDARSCGAPTKVAPYPRTFVKGKQTACEANRSHLTEPGTNPCNTADTSNQHGGRKPSNNKD